MKVLGIDIAVKYKGGHYTVMALENQGNGMVFVVLTSDKNKTIRLKHTDVEKLIDKGDICVSYVSSSPTKAGNASTSRQKKKP